MATKNRIVHRLWIIQITTIPRDKISKQNCLRFLYQERVGVINFMNVQNLRKYSLTKNDKSSIIYNENYFAERIGYNYGYNEGFKAYLLLRRG